MGYSKNIPCCLTSGWIGPMGNPCRRLERGKRMRSGCLWPQLHPFRVICSCSCCSTKGQRSSWGSLLYTTVPFPPNAQALRLSLRPGGSTSFAALTTVYYSAPCKPLPSHPYHMLRLESCPPKKHCSPNLQCLRMGPYLEIGSLQMIKLTWDHYSGLIQYDHVLRKRRNLDTETCIQREWR